MLIAGIEVLTYQGSIGLRFHTTEPFNLHFVLTVGISLKLLCLQLINSIGQFAHVAVIF